MVPLKYCDLTHLGVLRAAPAAEPKPRTIQRQPSYRCWEATRASQLQGHAWDEGSCLLPLFRLAIFIRELLPFVTK